jgi:hypothetical protein
LQQVAVWIVRPEAEPGLIEHLEFLPDLCAERDEPTLLAEPNVLQTIQPLAAMRGVGKTVPIFVITKGAEGRPIVLRN